MADVVALDHTFGGLNSPVPLSYLDDNFDNLVASLGDLNTFSNYLADTGSANVYAVTPGAGTSGALTNGLIIQMKVANANTSTATLNYAAGGAKAITNIDGSVLYAGQLPANGIVQLQYSSGTTSWLLQDIVVAVGTWTPSIGGSATYTTQSGQWARAGRFVTLRGFLAVNVIGSGSTSAITGIPFSAGDVSAPISLSGWSTLALSVNWLGGYINTSTITFTGTTAAATGTTNAIAILGNAASVQFSATYIAA